MILEEQIYQIEDQETFGEFTVKRMNMDIFEVVCNGAIVFKGEDYEVADYINNHN